MRLSELPEDIQERVHATRERVARLHGELPANNLVVWTAGNVSERVEGTDFFVIKPSGVRYDELCAETMVVCTCDGEKIDDGTPAELSPSSDTAAHAYVYRHMSKVGGIVHTHSTYATAFAAAHRPIPCVLTMMSDEFGGEVPVGPFAIIGDDSIGRGIVETLKDSRSPAVLMANHGPFTIGKNGEAAVKAAVMVEEVARTVAIAEQLGTPIPVAQKHTDTLYERYQKVYGQH
ncbi:L-ribulose-5-phosphate 4-epimerase [Schaalia sp. lx-260]|uniref:L-ribulose-5-phosphate 4-epimerase n=1 Tax=Schaalia sp. lx-260 TaxID=2899082 RepID=UPI001E3B6BBF|nr:L-ribulose-5-phosphate 4-epimerase [Schaalia sp. lx-260]